MATKKRQRHWTTDPNGTRAGFWNAILSEFGRPTASRSLATPLGGTLNTRPGMATSVQARAPDSTVTATRTVYSTLFVTVPSPNIPSEATATLSSLMTSQSSEFPLYSFSPASTTRSNSSISSVQTLPPSIAPVDSQNTTLLSITSRAGPTASSNPARNTTSSHLIGASSNDTKKRAIVGGLSGSIAAFIFIGLLICLILRMRRKKHLYREQSDPTSEKGIRPALLRTWTGLTAGGRGSPKHMNVTERSSSPVSVDEEHRIIRMNTRHWPRPFAPGAGEGYRESAPPGQLRVVNPDLSRPCTPRRPSESPAAFLKRQRSGLTGFVFGTYKSPRQSISRPIQQHEIPHDIPTITVIDPNLSRACAVPPYSRTPSFSSYPSVTSSPPNVGGQTPEDPFISPPMNSRKQFGYEVSRPSLAASSAGGSTRSHLLHPFRPRGNIPDAHLRSVSRYSTSSGGSRRSDPFDLDFRFSRHSLRQGSEFQRRSQAPNWILYEGT